MRERTFYLAYGMNTNAAEMCLRCPRARAVGRTVIRGRKLVFRRVADLLGDKAAEAPAVLWEITEDCERALDVLEGFPKLYVKTWFVVQHPHTGERVEAMAYVMRSGPALKEPSVEYLGLILEGYAEFGLDDAGVRRAAREAAHVERVARSLMSAP